MTKKYELVLDDTISFWGWKLFRIRALISFGSIEAGDLGGYIEKEENLSHDGNAWVSGDAKVSGNAKVWGDAKVSGNTKVWGDAKVWGNAKV
ncbi:polymer-forming cytoskeletal protein, partial [Streptococcus suis]